jgi:hypothetical protein
MTQPQGSVQTVALPAPGYPMVTRVISSALFPDSKGKEDPVAWVVSQPHPLVPQVNVVRMFLDRGGVEVYSVSHDGKAGMRNLIPISHVRLVEEAMPIDVFVEELNAAENDGDDELESQEEPEQEKPVAVAAPSNGQAAPNAS